MSTPRAQMARKTGGLSELKARLLFVLGALFVYRVGSHIPVPGIDPKALAVMFEQQSGSILDMFNMFSGGGFNALKSLRSWYNALYICVNYYAIDDCCYSNNGADEKRR